MNRTEYFHRLFEHLKTAISMESAGSSIAAKVRRLEMKGGIPAQKKSGRGKFEEIFTSEILVKHIASFHMFGEFRDQFGLTVEDVKNGLAYEGWNQKGQNEFGSSPITETGFKTLIRKSGGVSDSWKSPNSRGGLSNFSPCPDLAFKEPLPFTAVGDVKYIKDSPSANQILNDLQQAIREIFFYYAAFNLGRSLPFYESGFLIVGDATQEQLVLNVMRETNPELEDRFYSTPGFFPLILDAR